MKNLIYVVCANFDRQIFETHDLYLASKVCDSLKCFDFSYYIVASSVL